MAIQLNETEGKRLEKPTPMECLEQGYPMTMARQMDPEDLTREDCVKLLAAEFPRHIIAQKYNYPGGDFFLKLKEWGLNKPPKNWDFKKSDRAAMEPGGADPNKAEVERTATMLEPAPAQAEEPKALAPDDLTKEIAEQLLAEGVSKAEIRERYGMKHPVQLTTRLTRWGLNGKSDSLWNKQEKPEPEPVKPVESGADRQASAKGIQWYEDQRKTVLTEEEKADLFAGPESEELTGAGQGTALPPISEAVAQAAATGEIKVATREVPTPPASIDLAGWEPVSYANRQRITVPYLLVGVHGNGVIGNTDLRPGGRVQFRIGPEGRQIAAVPAGEGQLLYNERDKQRRFTGGHLADKLKAKGIALPARFRLEWNAALDAWIGELVEGSGER